jgi:hypothetical protein
MDNTLTIEITVEAGPGSSYMKDVLTLPATMTVDERRLETVKALRQIADRIGGKWNS